MNPIMMDHRDYNRPDTFQLLQTRNRSSSNASSTSSTSSTSGSCTHLGGPLPQPRLVLQAPLPQGLHPNDPAACPLGGFGGGGGGPTSGVFFNNQEIKPVTLFQLQQMKREQEQSASHSPVATTALVHPPPSLLPQPAMMRTAAAPPLQPLMMPTMASPSLATRWMPPQVATTQDVEELNDWSRHEQMTIMPDMDFYDFATGTTAKPQDAQEQHDDDDEVTALANLMAHEWKPFVKQVSKVMETEDHFPFQYVDIWAVDNKSRDNNTQNKKKKKVVLRHVGHATNRNTELCSIFTMYHMNEFGSASQKYVFEPGVGLPGRVLAQGQPVWDDSLAVKTSQTFSDFPRTDLAKKHGVQKGLGIPLTMTMGGGGQQAIIVLYTTADAAHDPSTVSVRNSYTRLIQGMYQAFRKGNTIPRSLLPSSSSSSSAVVMPVPATSLMMFDMEMMEEDEKEDGNHHRDQNHNPFVAFDVDIMELESLDSGRSGSHQSVASEPAAAAANYTAILPDDTEVEMATLLRDHPTLLPQQDHTTTNASASSLSLQCLLWRAPCRRSWSENVRMDALKRRFQTFQQNNQNNYSHTNHDNDKQVAATMLVLAWEQLCCSSTSTATTTTDSRSNTTGTLKAYRTV